MQGRVTLRRLKDETAELHEEAERYVRILDAGATVEDYARYLVAMLGYHRPIEASLARCAPLIAAGFDPAVRQRAELLLQDVRSLGLDPDAVARCTRLPASTTLGRAIGIAYVLEGSTLGGRYILAKLPPAIAALRGTSTAFLDGYGSATGERWRGFGAIVERAVDNDVAAAEAVAGARDTFATMTSWLAQFERRHAGAVRGIA